MLQVCLTFPVERDMVSKRIQGPNRHSSSGHSKISSAYARHAIEMHSSLYILYVDGTRYMVAHEALGVGVALMSMR